MSFGLNGWISGKTEIGKREPAEINLVSIVFGTGKCCFPLPISIVYLI